MFQASIPIEFWGVCILTARYLINGTPNSALHGLTPYEMLHQKAREYDHLRIFGSLCYAHNQGTKGDKFTSRSPKCAFMGYPYIKKGWHLYDIDTQWTLLFSLVNGFNELYVLVYVDDLVIGGNDPQIISTFKEYLSSCFHMKDLGALRYFLGIEFARQDEGFFFANGSIALILLSSVVYLDLDLRLHQWSRIIILLRWLMNCLLIRRNIVVLLVVLSIFTLRDQNYRMRYTSCHSLCKPHVSLNGRLLYVWFVTSRYAVTRNFLECLFWSSSFRLLWFRLGGLSYYSPFSF